MSIQVFFNIVYQVSILMLISYSFSINYNTSKFFNLTYAAYITISGYLFYLFHIQLNSPFIIAVIGGVAITVFLSYFLELTVFSKLKKRTKNPFILLIASIGVYTILQNLISIIWGYNALSAYSRLPLKKIEVLGGNLTVIQALTILVSIVILIIVMYFYSKSSIGRKVKAISSNEFLSSIYGINPRYVILHTTIISTLITACAGIFISLDTSIIPSYGFNILFYALVAMILGGTDNNLRLLYGVIIITTAQHLGAYYIGSKWMDAILYCVLIIILFIKPTGLSSKQLKKVEI